MTGQAMDEGTAVLSEAFSSVNATYDAGDLDPYALYRAYRETSPVTQGDLLARFGIPSQADFTQSGRPVITVYRYHDVMKVLRDQETFSATLMMEGFATFLGDVMLTGMDGAQHRQLRNLMQPAFSAQLLKRWAPMIQTSLRENYITPMLPQGRADLMAAFAVPFPVRVVYEVLGFPDDQEGTRKFAGWALKILAGFQTDPDQAEAAMKGAFEASEALFEHVLPIVAQRRAEGAVGDDMIAHLLRSEEDGRSFNDEQVTNLVRMLLTAATETTTRAFGNMMVHLLRRPEVLERVRADRSLVTRAVTESLRYETVSAFLARIATKDTELSGVPIPAGTALSLAMGSANRDSEMFVDGDMFDIDRPLKPNVAFGLGVHTCMGMPIARLELEGALNVVLDAMPGLRFDPDHPEPVIRGLQLRGPDTLHVRWN